MSRDVDLDVVFDTLPCGLLVADGAGSIVVANRRLHAILGYEPGQLIGRSVEDLMPQPHRAKHVGHRKGFTSTPIPREIARAHPLPALHRDGSTRQVEVGLAPCPTLGARHTLATVVDVTEREARRQSLATASRSEASLVAEIVSGMAHQFNNQLAAVLGTLELALEQVEDDGARALISSAMTAAERATQLTANLMGLQPEQGSSSRRTVVTRCLLDSEDVLRTLVQFPSTLQLAGESGDVRVALTDDELRQSLVSLVRNAATAIPPGGRIEVGSEPQGDRVRIWVQDNGPGFPEALLPHLARPFVTTRTGEVGSGLGLTAVEALARRCGGSLTLTNAPGGGAQATVSLPATEGADPPLEEQLTGRILVVDDERLVRETLASALRRKGHEVHIAPGGPEAAEMFDRLGGVDLLLTDVLMPDVDGIELARVLRQRSPGLGVLFVSGYSQDVLAQHGLQADDGIELIAKPFRIESVAQRVQHLLVAARRRRDEAKED